MLPVKRLCFTVSYSKRQYKTQGLTLTMGIFNNYLQFTRGVDGEQASQSHLILQAYIKCFMDSF